MKTFLNSSTVLAQASIFSALVGPRILLAPDDGGGNGGGTSGSGGGEGAVGGAGGSAGAAGAGDGAGQGGENGDAGKAGEGGPEGGEGKSLLAKAAEGTKADEGKAAKPTGEDGKSAEGEPKKEGEPSPADDGPKDVDGKPIPEKYEIKMPDGVEMDAAMLEAVTPLFREAKFSPAQAQAAADIYMQQQTKQLEAHSAMVAGWANEARADKEIGGAKFAENMAYAVKAFQVAGNERAMQIIDTYGLGNNPDILRMFVRIGKAMSEGGTVLGGDGGGRVSAARDMYPSMHQGQ